MAASSLDAQRYGEPTGEDRLGTSATWSGGEERTQPPPNLKLRPRALSFRNHHPGALCSCFSWEALPRYPSARASLQEHPGTFLAPLKEEGAAGHLKTPPSSIHQGGRSVRPLAYGRTKSWVVSQKQGGPGGEEDRGSIERVPLNSLLPSDLDCKMLLTQLCPSPARRRVPRKPSDRSNEGTPSPVVSSRDRLLPSPFSGRALEYPLSISPLSLINGCYH